MSTSTETPTFYSRIMVVIALGIAVVLSFRYPDFLKHSRFYRAAFLRPVIDVLSGWPVIVLLGLLFLYTLYELVKEVRR